MIRRQRPILAFIATVVLLMLAATATVAFESDPRARDMGVDFEVMTLFPAGTFEM